MNELKIGDAVQQPGASPGRRTMRGETMRAALALVGCLLMTPAMACDDHHGTCEIED